jgi:putative photosynthetic complex assembly protein 2
VSIADHLLPFVATLLLWFASTALIVWLVNRPQPTYRISLIWGAVAGIGGVALIAATVNGPGAFAAYLAFAGALAVWGWQELAFLTGAIGGPRRQPASAGAGRGQRFREATAVVIHHELVLAATAVVLAVMSWGAVNQVGATAFALLFVLRVSAKLNIHVGVPNLSDDLLPGHLDHFKSYFGPRRMTPALLLSVAATAALALWLGTRALAAPAGGEAVGASLLFALAALGALEHLFLALPVRDGALWSWAIPARPNGV